ncbi:MAG TPA: DUF481 domain-containing protein [Gemmatimonadetes bacterium]|nr:DUF481 domain-containing protein [Gemmatimonadota bacterium]HIC63874.1 DUF481 domain-containing protein [Gemmatimonadota bacterium]
MRDFCEYSMSLGLHLIPLRRHLFSLFIAFTVAFPVQIAAQVDIEALRTEDPSMGYSGSIGSNVTVRTGNVDFIQLGLNARLFHVDDLATTLVVANGGLGLLGRSRFASSGLLHYRKTYLYNRRISPEWFGQLNYDRSQRLDFRMVLGGGARTAFARGEWGEFGMGASIVLEHEALNLPEDAVHPNNTNTVRWSSFLTLRVVPTEDFVITSTTYMQPAYNDFSDLRMLGKIRIATPVTDELALTVSFNMRYDSGPPDGTSALDTTLKTGIAYVY